MVDCLKLYREITKTVDRALSKSASYANIRYGMVGNYSHGLFSIGGLRRILAHYKTGNGFFTAVYIKAASEAAFDVKIHYGRGRKIFSRLALSQVADERNLGHIKNGRLFLLSISKAANKAVSGANIHYGNGRQKDSPVCSPAGSFKANSGTFKKWAAVLHPASPESQK